MSSIGFLVAGVLLAGAAAPLRAQSLADVAKKEEERRRHAKTGKVYTNTDLAPARVPSSADTTPVAGTDAKDAADTTKDAAKNANDKKDSKDADKDGKSADKKSEEQGQGYWSKRMAGLRETLQRDQVYAEALQSRINALTTDFVNRDDPAQRAQISTQREGAVNELNRLKKQIEDDKKAITDAEEEARKSGVPAGWLR
jgi:hypothetical protein